MKRIILIGILGLTLWQANANTFFVKSGGMGKGSSWKEATNDLAGVLAIAKAGDEIWVAKGTYYPSADGNRRKAFNIPAGVKMYGGFAGNESSSQQRDFTANQTVLSGNISAKNDNLDNSYTVVILSKTDENTLLDGFIIADGYADGTGPSGDLDRCGGGLYIDGSGKENEARPIIQNCIFQNNYARDGGAVYVNGRQGRCNPNFYNCRFLNNRAELDGGAAFNDGRFGGEANPSYEDCAFTGNRGNYGGAMCNYGGKGDSSPNLLNCEFNSNKALLRGGAIYNMDVEGKTSPVIDNCQFRENAAVIGKTMYTFSKAGKAVEDEGMALNIN